MTPAPTMPMFVIVAKDDLAVRAVEHYARLCVDSGLPLQAREVFLAVEEMRVWRAANPEKCHMPDHRHIPTHRQGDGVR